MTSATGIFGRGMNPRGGNKNYGLLRQIELYCDGVAIATLHQIGADPASLSTAVRKVSGYNRLRFGIALNAERTRRWPYRESFAKSMIEPLKAADHVRR